MRMLVNVLCRKAFFRGCTFSSVGAVLGGALVSSAPTKLLVLSFCYALLTFSFRRSYSVFARLVQFYLAWCSFILVGALETSAPPKKCTP